MKTLLLPTGSLLAILLLGACATQAPPVPAEAAACSPESTRTRSYDTFVRLEELRAKAERYAQCMASNGLMIDQDALDRELLHFEQIKNADLYGVDPQMQVRIREQELRLSPRYWRKASAG